MILNEKHFFILRHALGLKDLERPIRNSFTAPTCGKILDCCNDLARHGYMSVTPGSGYRMFTVTDKGVGLLNIKVKVMRVTHNGETYTVPADTPMTALPGIYGRDGDEYVIRYATIPYSEFAVLPEFQGF